MQVQTYATSRLLKSYDAKHGAAVESVFCAPVWCERPGFESQQKRNF